MKVFFYWVGIILFFGLIFLPPSTQLEKYKKKKTKNDRDIFDKVVSVIITILYIITLFVLLIDR